MARGKKARKLVEATPPTLGQKRGDMMHQGRFDQDYGGFCPKNDDLCQMDTLWHTYITRHNNICSFRKTIFCTDGSKKGGPLEKPRLLRMMLWAPSLPDMPWKCKEVWKPHSFLQKNMPNSPPSFPLTSPSDKQRRSDKPNKTSSFGALGLWFVDAKWIQMVKTIGTWSNTE